MLCTEMLTSLRTIPRQLPIMELNVASTKSFAKKSGHDQGSGCNFPRRSPLMNAITAEEVSCPEGTVREYCKK
jgi:hypothetical protein